MSTDRAADCLIDPGDDLCFHRQHGNRNGFHIRLALILLDPLYNLIQTVQLTFHPFCEFLIALHCSALLCSALCRRIHLSGWEKERERLILSMFASYDVIVDDRVERFFLIAIQSIRDKLVAMQTMPT